MPSLSDQVPLPRSLFKATTWGEIATVDSRGRWQFLVSKFLSEEIRDFAEQLVLRDRKIN